MKIQEKSDKRFVLNHVGVEWIVYYDSMSNSFEVFHEDEAPSGDEYVQAPYAESAKTEMWKRFYEILNEEEMTIVNDFPSGRGFYRYLEEEGLRGTLECAQEEAEMALFDQWEKDHSLEIDWETVTIA